MVWWSANRGLRAALQHSLLPTGPPRRAHGPRRLLCSPSALSSAATRRRTCPQSSPNLTVDSLFDAVAASTVVPEKCCHSAEAARARCSTAAAHALLPPQHGRAIATTTAANTQRHEQDESIVWVARVRGQREAGRGDSEAAWRERKDAGGCVADVGAGGGHPLRRQVRAAAAFQSAAASQLIPRVPAAGSFGSC